MCHSTTARAALQTRWFICWIAPHDLHIVALHILPSYSAVFPAAAVLVLLQQWVQRTNMCVSGTELYFLCLHHHYAGCVDAWIHSLRTNSGLPEGLSVATRHCARKLMYCRFSAELPGVINEITGRVPGSVPAISHRWAMCSWRTFCSDYSELESVSVGLRSL